MVAKSSLAECQLQWRNPTFDLAVVNDWVWVDSCLTGGVARKGSNQRFAAQNLTVGRRPISSLKRQRGSESTRK